MSIIVIILLVLIILCLLLILYINTYNHYQSYIIRINEVESMIDTYLRNKYDLINKSIPIIKGNIKSEKEIFGEIVKLRSRKIGNFELYRILTRASNELNELRTEYNDIDNSNEIKKITKQIDDIDIKIDNAIEYYNDNITIYNSLLKKFPSNIIATFGKYKEKLFFDRKDMNDDDYDDFKL